MHKTFLQRSARRVLTVLALSTILKADQLDAQGTRADYERAVRLEKATANTVFKSTLKAHWFRNNTRFWYRNDLPGGAREFVLVDAPAGTRKPAFDHDRVAAALAKATGQETKATHLPVEGIEFTDNDASVLLRGPEISWQCNLASYEVTKADRPTNGTSTARKLDAPRPSRRTGEETSLLFVNRTQNEAELYWSDTSGKRVRYTAIAAGAQHRQHTFAGHVWLATDKEGRILHVFEAEEGGGTALIDGAAPPATTEQGTRDRGRRPARQNAESPDGKWQAFFKEHNLHVREVGTGQEFPLSRDGTLEDEYSGRTWWSPDSQRVVVLRTKKGDERKVHYIESSPKDQLQPKLHSYDYLKPGDRIPQAKPQLFEVATRKQTVPGDDLFPNPWSITELRWEPDSKRFVFLYNQRGHQVMRVIAVEAATGEARALVDEQCKTFFDYSGKLFLRHVDKSHELIWMSERDGWNHLYLYDAATGNVKNQITKGEWVVRGVDRVDEESRQIWFRAGGIREGQDPYLIHHCRVNFDGSSLTILTEGNGNHTVEYSPDRHFVINTWSRVDQPAIHELRRAEDGKLLCELDRADWSKLLATGWRVPEPFVAKGRDGRTDIYGIIVRPSHFDPQNKYPIIEDIYAGPHSAFVPKSFRSWLGNMNALAELGFIIVKIDGMGTSHRSKTFHDVACRNLGDSGFPDRIAWIKAAAAKYPYMDTSRVGIFGGSAGGQSSTRALLAHGDFYKAAVSDCGCHDNRMDKIWWNELWMGWPVGTHYEEQSNVTQAHRLQGKLMLFVGEMDENVDPASTLQVVNALIKADKDFDLVYMTGRGHGSAENEYGKRRRADFFVRHLLGVEPRR